MFWRMAGLSTASPVETILDKDNFTLDELLDEDEIIQECKALNSRLINFLQEKQQVQQLLHYIVEEAPEDAEKRRIFKFPFVSCEIFTCEVDIILKTLAEDEELMALLFSFLDPNRPHSTLLAGYFGKVVICLLLRKTVPLMNYLQAHQEILRPMVDLIGITSIMEVLVRMIAVDEHIYANHSEAMKWLENTDALEMIVDKFSSTDCPEVHANVAEALCSITRYAPPGLATKVASPSFIGRLFRNAFEESRPTSVLVSCLSVCICLLDPKRMTFGSYYAYSRQYAQGSSITANPETVEGMLESLDYLLKLLDLSSDENVLPTTYGKLQPPLGKHRLKIVEFAAVLLSIGNEAAEKELIRLGFVQRILDLFFEYPFNNFLHHHVETIVLSCLESKSFSLVEHILRDCNLVQKILEAEKNFALAVDPKKPTIPEDGKEPPRIGNIGHLTRICNKLVHHGNSKSEIQKFLQENNEWVEWNSTVLSKRNAVENVYQWTCGDDDDYQDRDYDVAALANNLSQAFRYDIYANEMEEGHGSVERDDEDVYFDDESAEVVISSLRLGDDQESSSLFTNSNWFAFEDEKINNDSLTETVASASLGTERMGGNEHPDNNELESVTTAETSSGDTKPIDDSNKTDGKPPEWVEWRETSSSSETPSSLPNGSPEEQSEISAEKESIPFGDDNMDQPQLLNEPKPSPETVLENEKTTGDNIVQPQLLDEPKTSAASVFENEKTADDNRDQPLLLDEPKLSAEIVLDNEKTVDDNIDQPHLLDDPKPSAEEVLENEKNADDNIDQPLDEPKPSAETALENAKPEKEDSSEGV
ncbi:hypothetical protein V2J09_003085 [Rumex salicifolius]